MPGRGLAVAAVVVTALAGCGEGGRGAEETAGAETPAAGASATTDTQTGSTEAREDETVTAGGGAGAVDLPEGAPATADESRWTARVLDWANSLAVTVELLEPYRDPIRRREPLGAERTRVVRLLGRLAACEAQLERIGPPATLRLMGAHQSLVDACESYSAGAEAALELVRTRPDPTLRPILVGLWDDVWRHGDDQVFSVAKQIEHFHLANSIAFPRRRGPASVSRLEPVFSRVASRLVRTRVDVRCWSERDWTQLLSWLRPISGDRTERARGLVLYGSDQAELHPKVCDRLVALRYRGERPASGAALVDTAFAVSLLMHEAQHVRGVWVEASAECYGMQMIREAAAALGAPPDYAALLAETQWTRTYPYVEAVYRSPECRDGGGLDADRASPVWP